MNKRKFNYSKLWKLLKSRGLTRYYLVNNALGYTMSTATLAKLGKGQSVTTDTLLGVCNLLDVDLNDIVETEVTVTDDE